MQNAALTNIMLVVYIISDDVKFSFYSLSMSLECHLFLLSG